MSGGAGETAAHEQEIEDYDSIAANDEFSERSTGVLDPLAGLYGLYLTSLGVVFPVSIYLSDSMWKSDGVYLAIFEIYIYLVGSVIYGSIAAQTFWRSSYFCRRKVNEDKEQEAADDKGGTPQVSGSATPRTARLITTTNDASIFLRLGLIGFSLCAVVMEGFQLLQFYEVPGRMWKCFGITYITISLLRITFILCQSYVLFKYHLLTFEIREPVLRFAFSHVIATNLCTWSLTVVNEAYEVFAHSFPHVHSTNSSHNGTDNRALDIRQCVLPNTLSTKAGPYLHPFIIEYSLMAAAIAYGMVQGLAVGRACKGGAINDARGDTKGYHSLHRPGCHKANSGLFFGLIIFGLVTLGACVFVYFRTTSAAPKAINGLIHVSCQIVTNVLGMIFLIPAFVATSKLKHVQHEVGSIDKDVLLLTLLGYYLLLSFIALASFSKLHCCEGGAIMLASMCVVEIVEITLQTAFILDAFSRRIETDDQNSDKPGRSWITFLILCNLGMWVINTFELRDAYDYSICKNYFGFAPWVIILNLTLPVSVYFRFHSTICLTQIWADTYK